MKGLSLAIFGGVVGIAVGAGALAFGGPGSGDGSEAPAGLSPLEQLTQVMEATRRQAAQEFETFSMNDADAGLGRRYIIMEGGVSSNQASAVWEHVFTAAEAIDVDTLMLSNRGTIASIYLLEEDEGSIPILDRLKILISTEDERPTRTISLNPPLRLDEGDRILMIINPSVPSTNGFSFIGLQGRIPTVDTLSIH